MPLSDWLQTRKIDSALPKMTNCSSNVSSFMPDNDFVELLWENGQIVMQGQSNRPRTSSFSTIFSAHAGRVQEKDGRDAATPKAGRLEEMGSMVNAFSPSQPEGGEVGLNAQDDDMVPWIHYPIEDSLHNDYCSDFLPEIAGVNLNFPSANGNAASVDRGTEFAPTVRSSYNLEHGHTPKDLAGVSGNSDRTRTNQSFPAPPQCQGPIPGAKPRSAKQDLTAAPRALQPSSGTGLMNFSHFSRPAAMAKANLHSVDRLRSNDKASASTTSNLMESTIIQSTSSPMQGKVASVPPKLELRSPAKPPPTAAAVSVERSGAICQEDWPRRNSQQNHVADDGNIHANHQSPNIAVKRAAGGRHEAEKGGTEAVVASSSVCSGNSGGTASNDPKHGEKRKHHEEDSSNHSEDLEDESVGLKKPATLRSAGTKRSRAAEVHNLSERRRRDRINEKMRALQELIPNCNKVDKASMLDEAIEYLKTLQLQVQMMSMASGLYMSPMMLQAGMPHMRMPHMAHFSQMGAGMGMGMGMRLGYGMGMLDMNGSPGCPLIPVPPMHGPPFPCPSVPGVQGLHGLPGSAGLPMFGIPGQVPPMSMPRAPSLGCLSGLPPQMNSSQGVLAAATAAASNPLPAPVTAPSFSTKDQQQQCINLETLHKASAENSQIQTSSKGTKESYDEAALVQTRSNQMLLVSENGTAPARATSFG